MHLRCSLSKCLQVISLIDTRNLSLNHGSQGTYLFTDTEQKLLLSACWVDPDPKGLPMRLASDLPMKSGTWCAHVGKISHRDDLLRLISYKSSRRPCPCSSILKCILLRLQYTAKSKLGTAICGRLIFYAMAGHQQPQPQHLGTFRLWDQHLLCSHPYTNPSEARVLGHFLCSHPHPTKTNSFRHEGGHHLPTNHMSRTFKS